MHLLTIATTLFLSFLTTASAWEITSGKGTDVTKSLPPTTIPTACPTVTQFGGSTCKPTPSSCVVIDCIFLSTITQPCDCVTSLPTSTICETTCHSGCATTWEVVRIPCATSVPSSSKITSSSSYAQSSSSSISSSSSSCSGTTSKPYYSNSTITVTSITTLTTCPHKEKCHGQTTTWKGTEGPFSCSTTSTCTCVLPGGGNQTITGPTTTTQVTTTAGKGSTSLSTSSVGPTSSGLLQSSHGERTIKEGWIGMIIVALVGLL